jgi:hypothetical protein
MPANEPQTEGQESNLEDSMALRVNSDPTDTNQKPQTTAVAEEQKQEQDF